jgi:putative SOS response-associated peptidase YedK
LCSRFVQYSNPDIYASRYDLERIVDAEPRYNVALTHPVIAISTGSDGKRELVPLRWGLVPFWSKGPDNRSSMVNASAETASTRRTYRAAFKSRRCLIPTEGFYEWRSV